MLGAKHPAPMRPRVHSSSGRSDRWTRERLSQFLTDAQATYPGASIPQAMLFTEHEINLVGGVSR